MRNQRGKLAGLSVLTALGLLLSGCTGPGGSAGGGTPATPATSAADPKQALAAATAELQQGNYTFTTAGHTDKGKGVVHLPSRSAAVDMTTTSTEGAGRFQILVVEPDRYIKLKADMAEVSEQLGQLKNLPKTPEMTKMSKQLNRIVEMFSGKKWLHVDLDKIKDKSLQLDLTDPDVTGASALLGTVATAQRQGDTITGTLDAVKALEADSPLSDDTLSKKAAELKELPYTATLDGQGRLVKLVIDVPAAGDVPAHQRTIEITGYGTGTAQQKPAGAQVMEMPAESYEMLNS